QNHHRLHRQQHGSRAPCVIEPAPPVPAVVVIKHDQRDGGHRQAKANRCRQGHQRHAQQLHHSSSPSPGAPTLRRLNVAAPRTILATPASTSAGFKSLGILAASTMVLSTALPSRPWALRWLTTPIGSLVTKRSSRGSRNPTS